MNQYYENLIFEVYFILLFKYFLFGILIKCCFSLSHFIDLKTKIITHGLLMLILSFQNILIFYFILLI